MMEDVQCHAISDRPILGSAAAPIDLTSPDFHSRTPGQLDVREPEDSQSTSSQTLTDSPETVVGNLFSSSSSSSLSTPPKIRKRKTEKKTKTPWVPKYATSIAELMPAGELAKSINLADNIKHARKVEVWKARKNASAAEIIAWVKEERKETVLNLRKTRIHLHQYHIDERKINDCSPFYHRNAPWNSGYAPPSTHDGLVKRKKYLEREVRRMTAYIGDADAFAQEQAASWQENEIDNSQYQDAWCRDCSGGFISPFQMHCFCAECGRVSCTCSCYTPKPAGH